MVLQRPLEPECPQGDSNIFSSTKSVSNHKRIEGLEKEIRIYLGNVEFVVPDLFASSFSPIVKVGVA